MADSAQAFTADRLAALKAAVPGLVAVARYLFAGATVSGTDATVPTPVADPLTTEEIATIAAAGLALLPIANNFGYGEEQTPASCAATAQQAIDQMQALGMPAGVYPVWDLETWPFVSGAVSAILAVGRASIYGGSGVLYCNPASAVVTEWQALRGAGNADAQRALLWIARYVPGAATTPPPWAPGVDDPAVVAWQDTDHGPDATDLSEIRLGAILSVGGVAEGLLLPDGGVGAPPSPDRAAALAAIDAAQAALQKARAAL